MSTPAPAVPAPVPARPADRIWGWALALFAFLLYADTLHHGFTLDDVVVITQNRYVQQGLGGLADIFSHDSFDGYLGAAGENGPIVTGGRYRPLSLALFATVQQFFGAKPRAFHLLAVLLYALSCALLFRLLSRLLQGNAGVRWVPLLAAALFAAHPVHTEVVANVKGCDEILALLFSLAAWQFALLAVDRQKPGWSLVAGMAFFAACLAKETALAFALVIPISLWAFRGISLASSLRRCWPTGLALLLFLLLRGSVLGWQFGGQMMHDPLNNPFLKYDGQAWVPFSFAEKTATLLYCLGQYLRLLVWPWPLTHDYYPRQIGVMDFGKMAVWASVAMWTALLVFVGWGFRKIRVESEGYPIWTRSVWLGALLFLLALGLVSNVLFPVGTFMGERFLFTPSVGFVLALAAVCGYFLQRKKAVTLAAFGAVLVLFSGTTLLRNPDWRDNETLYRADIRTSANSAKAQNDLGNTLLVRALQIPDAAARQALMQEADAHLDRAIALHPTFYDAYLAEGACSYYLGDFNDAISAYRMAYRIYPADEKSRVGLAWSLRDAGRFLLEQRRDAGGARPLLKEALQLLPQDTATQRLLRDTGTQ